MSVEGAGQRGRALLAGDADQPDLPRLMEFAAGQGKTQTKPLWIPTVVQFDKIFPILRVTLLPMRNVWL